MSPIVDLAAVIVDCADAGRENGLVVMLDPAGHPSASAPGARFTGRGRWLCDDRSD
jgi:hypothetical protein